MADDTLRFGLAAEVGGVEAGVVGGQLRAGLWAKRAAPSWGTGATVSGRTDGVRLDAGRPLVEVVLGVALARLYRSGVLLGYVLLYRSSKSVLYFALRRAWFATRQAIAAVLPVSCALS